MQAIIKQMRDNEGNSVLPLTSTKAVFDENGTRLDEILASKVPEINNAKEEALNEIEQASQSGISSFNEQKVTPAMLSEETKQYINAAGGGTINNLPDGEDLEVKDLGDGQTVIQLADKAYSAENFSGLARTYLRKNMVEGKNVLTQEMINEPNTIYHIQYNYDLNGATINIPENCVLQFDGGSLKNGALVGNNTIIVNGTNNVVFLETLSFSGTFKIPNIYLHWFDFHADGINDDFNQFQKLSQLISCIVGGSNIYFHNKAKYYCIIPDNGTVKPGGDDFTWPTIMDIRNTDSIYIDMLGSTIKSYAGNLPAYLHYRFYNSTNCRLSNGYITGDALEHDYSPYTASYNGSVTTTHEWGYGIYNQDSTLLIENIEISLCIGASVSFRERDNHSGEKTNTIIRSCYFHHIRKNGFSVGTSGKTIVENCIIDNIGDFEYEGQKIAGCSPKSNFDIEPESGDKYFKSITINNTKFGTCNGFGITFSLASGETGEEFIMNNCLCECNLYIANQLDRFDVSNCVFDSTNDSIKDENKHSYYLLNVNLCNTKIKTSTKEFIHIISPKKIYNCEFESAYEKVTYFSSQIIHKPGEDIIYENCKFKNFFGKASITGLFEKPSNGFYLNSSAYAPNSLTFNGCELENCNFNSNTQNVEVIMNNCKYKDGFIFVQKAAFNNCELTDIYGYLVETPIFIFNSCKILATDKYITTLFGSVTKEFYNCNVTINRLIENSYVYENFKAFNSYINWDYSGTNKTAKSSIYNCIIKSTIITSDSYNGDGDYNSFLA